MGLKQNCNVQSRTIKLQTRRTGIVVCHRVDVPRKCVILGVLNERHHILAKPFSPYGRCRHRHPWPSGCELTAACKAILLLAPSRFSIMNAGQAAPTATVQLGGHEGRRSRPAKNLRSSAPAASGRLAPTRCATRPAARQRPLRDAENFGGEVSL